MNHKHLDSEKQAFVNKGHKNKIDVVKKLDELKVYEKQIEESKKEILKKIVINALYSLKLPKFVPHSTKVIKLNELPNFSSTTIGQLLGKDGKHKSEFVNITGVNMQLCEPANSECIFLSKYNPADIEKARLLISKLLEKDNWSPSSMSSKYEEVVKIFDASCIEEGRRILLTYLKYEKATDTLSKLVGLLKYTWSYNQNILDHSFAVGDLCANIAGQLDLDILCARRAGFFHDIGKVNSDLQDHVEVGVKMAQEEKLDDYIINTIASHHGGPVTANNPYAIIAKAMDKVSAGWPGERPMQNIFVNERTKKITSELKTIEWIENLILKKSGNLIIIFIKIDKFEMENLPAMELELKEKLTALKLHYEYNYQIEMKLFYQKKFLINEVKSEN